MSHWTLSTDRVFRLGGPSVHWLFCKTPLDLHGSESLHCKAAAKPGPGLRAGHIAQGLVQRFTSAFEETKRELEAVTNDLEHSFSLQLATKLNSEELPQKLQEASLVSRATLQAHVKQVSLVLYLCDGKYTSAFWHADVLANLHWGMFLPQEHTDLLRHVLPILTPYESGPGRFSILNNVF